jgi:hypothetical protein
MVFVGEEVFFDFRDDDCTDASRGPIDIDVWVGWIGNAGEKVATGDAGPKNKLSVSQEAE